MKALVRAAASLSLAAAVALPAAELHVRATDGAAGLRRALAEARDGDTVHLEDGRYAGRFIIERGLHLIGEGWPILDGGDTGTVLTVRGRGAVVRGIVVRGSGASLDQENSGIALGAPDIRIVHNRLEDVLFGIYARKSPGAVVRDNVVRTKALDLPRRGDAIRIWYSDGVTIVGNRVASSRDVVLWYSANLVVRDNVVRDGRYGLHFMYCDDARIEHNLLLDNSVGAFLMYSRRLHLISNTIVGNHGPSGYGVGLKDMDDAEVRGNLFAGNRVGAYLDNSPRDLRSRAVIAHNRFIRNDNGIELMPNVERVEFDANGFEENREQIAWGGRGGDPAANEWRGNYWSDYRGYDLDGDGVGEVSYRAERLFEALSDRSPDLRLFRYSPVSRAVDLAARVLPVVKPRPKLEDPAPAMRPPQLGDLPTVPRRPGGPVMPVAAGMLAGAGLLWAGPRWARRSHRPATGRVAMQSETERGELPVRAGGLRKRFDGLVALDGVSFEIEAGGSVALWGANGAGKTTLLRALLGVLPCDGTIRVFGVDPRRSGKIARGLIGFVPQEIAFQPELRVAETLQFYGRLRRVERQRIDALMERLQLVEHADKRVRELSGGLKQRLALAVALLSDPPVLFLDEPTANLDAASRRDFIHLLSWLKSEKTLVFTSHRVEEVLALADRVLWLERGRLVRDTPAEALLRLGGDEASLRILVPESRRVEAESVLSRHAFDVESLGPYLTVHVAPREKANCLWALFEGGIPVEDFGIDVNGVRTEDDRAGR
jgi:nitrous oxidase accessory protein